MKTLRLQPAFLVSKGVITPGFAMVLPVFIDGISETEDQIIFTHDKQTFVKRDWNNEICFTEQEAKKAIVDDLNSSLDYARRRIRIYSEEIEEITEKLNAL